MPSPAPADQKPRVIVLRSPPPPQGLLSANSEIPLLLTKAEEEELAALDHLLLDGIFTAAGHFDDQLVPDPSFCHFEMEEADVSEDK